MEEEAATTTATAPTLSILERDEARKRSQIQKDLRSYQDEHINANDTIINLLLPRPGQLSLVAMATMGTTVSRNRSSSSNSRLPLKVDKDKDREGIQAHLRIILVAMEAILIMLEMTCSKALELPLLPPVRPLTATQLEEVEVARMAVVQEEVHLSLDH